MKDTGFPFEIFSESILDFLVQSLPPRHATVLAVLLQRTGADLLECWQQPNQAPALCLLHLDEKYSTVQQSMHYHIN